MLTNKTNKKKKQTTAATSHQAARPRQTDVTRFLKSLSGWLCCFLCRIEGLLWQKKVKEEKKVLNAVTTVSISECAQC